MEKDGTGGFRFNEMTRNWVNSGHKVTVISGMTSHDTGKKREKYKGKFIVKDVNENGLTVYRCHVSEAYNASFVGRLWAYFSFVFSSIICCFFYAREKYNVVLVTSPPLFVGITGYLVSKLKRIPLVFEIRDLWPESAIDTGVLTNKTIIKFAFWFEKFIYKNSALINTLTPAFKKKLIENKNVSASKVIMIPNAADFTLAEEVLKNFDPVDFRKKKGWENKMVVTYVGAHGLANHLIQVVDTAERLKDKEDIFLLMIGEGMQREFLVQEVQKRNLKNIEFMGSVSKSEVFKYILASDIGTSVLKNVDTFKTVYSNKTFDYMSCKKPVLMAIDGISRELVEDAKCGLYVEPENPKDFAEKILVYYNQKSKIHEDGMNGYNYAKNKFDRNYLAETYLNELQKVARK